MDYHETETRISLGDKVTYAGAPATIVFIINDNLYSEAYRDDYWPTLIFGLGFELEDRCHTLVYLDAPDEDLVFISRLMHH